MVLIWVEAFRFLQTLVAHRQSISKFNDRVVREVETAIQVFYKPFILESGRLMFVYVFVSRSC